MAAVVPLVASFVAGGASIAGMGAALAGASGFAAFAGVAGGIMSSIGMLTGSKTLTKVGGLLGLAGAVTGLASSMSSGAAEAASSAAGKAAGTAGEEIATEGVGEALKSEFANSAVGETIGQASGAATTSMAPGVAQVPNGSLGSLGSFSEAPSSAMQLDPSSLGVQPQNLMDQVRANWGQSGVGDVQNGFGSSASAGGVSPVLVEAGQQFKDSNTLNSLLEKLKGAGQWAGDKLKAGAELIEKNPATAKLAGSVLQGGMQMYASNDAMNQQLNLIEQRRRRLNSPVALGMLPQLNRTPGG